MMSLIKGIPIIYINKIQTGTDGFGMPVYEEVEEIVENVLVAPATSDDIVSSTDLQGKKLVYTLAIPKGDTHTWEDCKVKFFGRTFKSFGYPLEGIEELIPMDWHKKVMVEAYE